MKTTMLFPQLFTVTELVTPEKAAEYLKANFLNRTISKPKVEKHKRAIKAGKFRHTHQGIAFDWFGNLRDGQHRLTAIAEGDASVTMQVTRGLDPDSVSSIDTEMRVRSTADALRLAGNYSASKQAVAVCNLWLDMQGTRSASMFEVEDFLNSHSEAIAFALEVGLNHPNLKHACVLTMLAAGYEAGHADEVRAWAEIVKSGEISEQWQTSAIRFRDYWMTTKHNGGASLRLEYCQRIYASMTAWIERRGLMKLYAKQSIEWFGAGAKV
jgi:hypothetical protein